MRRLALLLLVAPLAACTSTTTAPVASFEREVEAFRQALHIPGNVRGGRAGPGDPLDAHLDTLAASDSFSGVVLLATPTAT